VDPLPPILTARVLARTATVEDAPLVQACLDAAPDYSWTTAGARAPADAALDLLRDAEADPERRVFLLSPPGGGTPFGVLDLYLHQPEPEVAHLALLLLRERSQGQGLGREVVEALTQALSTAGFAALRLSVTDENPGARAFWERLGFAPAGRLEQGVTVYEKRLSPLP